MAATLSLSDDKLTLTLDLDGVQRPMTANQVDVFIASLLSARGAMLPEVGRELTAGETVGATHDPIWRGEFEGLTETAFLHLRQDGGWMHYLFPKAEAVGLAQWLLKVAEAIPDRQAN